MANRDKAQDFLRTLIAGRVRQAYDEHVGEGFVHHNAHFAAGKDALMAAMEEDAKSGGEKSIDIKRTLEDGDLVAAHSHVKLRADHPGYATVHIMRFRDGKIVEFWDVVMDLPVQSPNTDGVF
jgi:predicted SnoaL-like aldol condensation-catalyzing enzyme